MRLQRRLSTLALACAAALPAQATGLAEAFEAARQFDGQYRAAQFELDASRQLTPIARAALLPIVQISASTQAVSGTREFPNFLDQQVRVPVDYEAPQASLQLRTPLFNYESWSRYKQAGVQVEGAEAAFEVRRQELVERVGTAYLQLALAQEAASLAENELSASESQSLRSQQRNLRGEGTRTEVAQTDANLDLARVKKIEAYDQLELAQRALRKLTGQEMTVLQGLPRDFVPSDAQAGRLIEWIDLGERQSPTLRVRRLNVEVARLAIERARAGHLPRVDLFASVSRSRNESISSLNQASSLKSLGVQLNVPLYSGGGVDAVVKQSVFEREKAEEELRNEREQMVVEIQRQFGAVRNGAARVEAYRRVVASSEVALEGVSRALGVGLATQSDVLETQARRFAAMRELAQVRNEYLLARLRLLALAGLPAQEIVADLDRSLTAEFQIKTRTTP